MASTECPIKNATTMQCNHYVKLTVLQQLLFDPMLCHGALNETTHGNYVNAL